MPTAGLVFAALLRHTGHALDHAQAAEIRKDARVPGQEQRPVFYPGFQDRHGLPVPGFGDHDLPDLFRPVLLPCGFSQGAAVSPCVQGDPGKARQGIQDGEQDLLLGTVRAVAQLKDERRHKAQIPLFRGGPENG